jgi:hypothetical protein
MTTPGITILSRYRALSHQSVSQAAFEKIRERSEQKKTHNIPTATTIKYISYQIRLTSIDCVVIAVPEASITYNAAIPIRTGRATINRRACIGTSAATIDVIVRIDLAAVGEIAVAVCKSSTARDTTS